MRYLDKHYANMRVMRGDIHEHSNSGGRSDGKRPLSEWIDALKEKGMEFEAILDHRQVRHMYLDEYDKFCFLCGTEPGTFIVDCKDTPNAEGNRQNCMHYNMIFRKKGDLEKVLEAFPEFGFEGGNEGFFNYPSFTRERMQKLRNMVTDMGGFYVHPHPCDLMQAEDVSEYVFGDFMGIEVFYRNLTHRLTAPQYDLWKKILAKGHKVYACAGVDSHEIASNEILTTLYAETLSREVIVDTLHRGNFVCGNAGIKMCIGDTVMGGVHKLSDGDMLEICVGDIAPADYNADTVYHINVYANEDIKCSVEFKGSEPVNITIPALDKGYYRVEVIDTARELPIALGNPIWVEV